jgi:hypothetical protein
VFKVIPLLFLSLAVQSGFAQAMDGKSAHREPGISYKAYAARARIMSQGNLNPLDQVPHKSPVDSAVEYDKATLPSAAAWDSAEIMQKRFEDFRDLRFIADSQHAGFERRSSWLYPDDGCFARAALAIRNLLAMAAKAPSKIFVFGDLNVKTVNSPDGSVSWWYHVAPIVEVAGQKYVLDPAIEPHHPLKIEDWLATMSTTPQTLQVAICESGSYQPYDDCDKVSDGKEDQAQADQVGYLGLEWERLQALQRNPDQELGDNPPWKN